MNCQKNNRPRGFSILEIIVSLSLFSIIIILMSSMYILSQRSYSRGAEKSELSQNARVSIERMSREIRQAVSIETQLPATSTDPLNPPANELFFQDGHDASQTTYTKYYLDGTDLKRSRIAYYFNTDPGNYVIWSSRDQFGGSPIETTTEDRIISEYFSELQFWGNNGLVNISAGLANGQANLEINTSIYCRN